MSVKKKKWGLLKTVKREEWAYIQKMERKRKHDNKETEIVAHNKVIRLKQLRRAAKWVRAKSSTFTQPQGKFIMGFPLRRPSANRSGKTHLTKKLRTALSCLPHRLGWISVPVTTWKSQSPSSKSFYSSAVCCELEDRVYLLYANELQCISTLRIYLQPAT